MRSFVSLRDSLFCLALPALLAVAPAAAQAPPPRTVTHEGLALSLTNALPLSYEAWGVREAGALRGMLYLPSQDATPDPARPELDPLAAVFVHGLAPPLLHVPSVPRVGLLPWAVAGYHAPDTEAVQRFYWSYPPDRSYDELAEEFAAALAKAIPGRRLVIVAQSAGAVLARLSQPHLRAAGIRLEAVIGVGAAHGGVQGASLIMSDDALQAHPSIQDAGRQAIQLTRQQFGAIPRAAMASVVYDNADGGFPASMLAIRGADGGPALKLRRYPAIEYARFDHVVDYRSKTAPDAPTRPYEDLTSELLARISPEAWSYGDGMVPPYLPAQARHLSWSTGGPEKPWVGAEWSHGNTCFSATIARKIHGQLEQLARGGVDAVTADGRAAEAGLESPRPLANAATQEAPTFGLDFGAGLVP